MLRSASSVPLSQASPCCVSAPSGTGNRFLYPQVHLSPPTGPIWETSAPSRTKSRAVGLLPPFPPCFCPFPPLTSPTAPLRTEVTKNEPSNLRISELRLPAAGFCPLLASHSLSPLGTFPCCQKCWRKEKKRTNKKVRGKEWIPHISLQTK